MNPHDLHHFLRSGYLYSRRAITREVCSGELMPGQPKILEFLLIHDGCTQREISQGCLLDKSTVTSLLSRMEKSGLITKRPEGKDRRCWRVCLTAEGRDRAAWVTRVCTDIDDSAWKNISPEEQETFIRTFEKIMENLKRLEENL
ncbi:MarR family transcriptional regulator [Candidatus Bariatricus faecipullorum]